MPQWPTVGGHINPVQAYLPSEPFLLPQWVPDSSGPGGHAFCDHNRCCGRLASISTLTV